MEINESKALTRPGKNLSSRTTRRIGAVVLLSLLGFAAIAAYAMFNSLPGRIRVAPVSIVVHSASSLPPEVQALEAQTAPLLFDRDTRSAHVAYADQRIDAKLDKATEIRAIKLYGAAPYELTVLAQQGSAWTAIPGLTKLKLASLSAEWNEFTVTQAITAQTLRFELTVVSTVSAGNGNGGGGNAGGKGKAKGNGNATGTTTPTSGGIAELESGALETMPC